MSKKYDKWSIGDLKAEQHHISKRIEESYALQKKLDEECLKLEYELEDIQKEIDKNRIMNNNRKAWSK